MAVEGIIGELKLLIFYFLGVRLLKDSESGGLYGGGGLNSVLGLYIPPNAENVKS